AGGSGGRAGAGGEGVISGEAGTAGAGGGPGCYAATTTVWRDITPLAETEYELYASLIESGAFPGHDALVELPGFLPDEGTFVPGTDNNDNWSSCSQCLVVLVDEGNAHDRIFFADGGVLQIESSSDVLEGTIDASLTNAHFVEVTIDEDYPYASHLVDGG